VSLTQERLKELLDYDPETGHFTWRMNRYNGTGGLRSTAGSRAGAAGHCTRRDGLTPRLQVYWFITIEGRLYRAHRLAFLYMLGRWPSSEVDHKDGDSINNRWANLREATSGQNSANSKRRRDNKSGFKGVSRARNGRWRADIRVNKRQIYLGLYRDPQAAHEAYVKAAQQHFGEFARAA
jgi:hypothetical protein